MPTQVFLSHSSRDLSLARKIATALRKAGLSVRDPAADALPGDDWARIYSDALETSQAMVVLLTPDALESHWVQREIDYALGELRYKHRLIPVIVGSKDEIPEDRIPWILRRLTHFRLTEEDHGAVEQIADAILRAA